jgi:formamidopyrimidine-DNA glycosylase
MPELPDISACIAALEPRILGQRLEHVRLASVFVLRTADTPAITVGSRFGTPSSPLTPPRSLLAA